MFQIASAIKQVAVTAWNNLPFRGFSSTERPVRHRVKRERPNWVERDILGDESDEESIREIPLTKRRRKHITTKGFHLPTPTLVSDFDAEASGQQERRQSQKEVWDYVVGEPEQRRRYFVGKCPRRSRVRMPRRVAPDCLGDTRQRQSTDLGHHVGDYRTTQAKTTSAGHNTTTSPSRQTSLFGTASTKKDGAYAQLTESPTSTHGLRSHHVAVFDNLGYARSPAFKQPSTVENVIRLEERKRYRKLLQYFTSIVLADESDPRQTKSPSRSHAVSLPKVEDVVGVFQSSLVDESCGAKPYDKQNTSWTTTVSPISNSTKVTTTPDSTATSSERMREGHDQSDKSSGTVDDILGPEWISKWRQALDPVSLSRQREIAATQKEVDNLRENYKADISNVIKQRIKDETETDPGLYPLSASEQETIDTVLRIRESTKTVSEIATASVMRSDLNSLLKLNWLNDEVINFYLNLLKERSITQKGLPKVHAFNTFFYPKLLKTKHAGVRRWTKKFDLFSLDLVLFPIHLGVHWCLAAIDFRRKRICYYDSMKGNNAKCLSELRQYLDAESLDKKKKPFDFDGWQTESPKNIPEQLNGCDCGAFACKYAECLSRGAKFAFSQNDMPLIRNRIIHSIITKKV